MERKPDVATKRVMHLHPIKPIRMALTYALDSIFLIAATSTFVRFIHFRFGRDYLEYLDARGEAAQKEIVEDEENEAFAYMRSTRWFNLQSSEGRRAALCHVLALLRWHDAQVSSQGEDDSDSADDSEYSREYSIEVGERGNDGMDIEE